MNIYGTLHVSRDLKASEADMIDDMSDGTFSLKSDRVLEASGELDTPERVVSNIVDALGKSGGKVHGIIDASDDDKSIKIISLGGAIRVMNTQTRTFSAVK
jgi:hypothetical protein